MAKRRWYQFSLRTLLLAVLLASLVLSWYATRQKHARERREAVEAVLKSGGLVCYDCGAAGATIHADYRNGSPTWLERTFGIDFCYHVTGASVRSDGGAEHLERLTELKELECDGADVTDAMLQHVAGLGKLERLCLVSTKITDAGLARVGELPSLSYLDLSSTQVTDAGLEHLKELKHPLTVDVTHTRVTIEGAKGLQERLPKGSRVAITGPGGNVLFLEGQEEHPAR